jgi:hypothetical protein
MSYFVQANGHHVSIRAKIQYDNMHGFVSSNSLIFELVEFYIAHY